MKVFKYWRDLPEVVEKNIDIATNFHDVTGTELVNNVRELLKPFNATYDNYDNGLCFKSEAHYQWFLLKWS